MAVKKCFVKSCTNNSADNSDKLFLPVPRDMRIREKWFYAIGIKRTTTHPTLYCCEDHFDLPICADNWTEHTLFHSRVKLKKGVVPHKNIKFSEPTNIGSQVTSFAMKQELENFPKSEKSEACLDLIYSDHNYCQSSPVNFVAVNVDQFEVSYEEFNTAGPSGVNFNKFNTEDDPLGLPSTSTNAEYKDDSVNAVIVKREVDDFNDIATENIIIDSPECFVSSCMDFNEYGVGDGFVKCEIDDFTDFPVEVKSENSLEIFYNKITTEENESGQFCTQVHPEHKTETICDTRIKVEIEDENVMIKSEIDDRCS